MPLVTMFTDASWNRATLIGVWSMWAKLDGNTIRYSGILRNKMPQIGTAELSAIANGLFCIKRKFQCEENTKIIAQTDSLEAISAINSNNHPRPEDNALALHIKEFVKTNGWRLELRHVKGHKGTATRRNAVNTWCDRECKRQMGIALRERSDLQLDLPLEEVA